MSTLLSFDQMMDRRKPVVQMAAELSGAASIGARSGFQHRDDLVLICHQPSTRADREINHDADHRHIGHIKVIEVVRDPVEARLVQTSRLRTNSDKLRCSGT